MRPTKIHREPDQGYGEKLIINAHKFAEVDRDGDTTVYGTFTPYDVAALVKAAYLLGREHAETVRNT